MNTILHTTRAGLVLAFCLAAVGCGGGSGGTVSVHGKVTRNGQPVTIPKNTGMLAVTFHYLKSGGATPSASYNAAANSEDGTYTLTAIPPGKYRVSVQIIDEYGPKATLKKGPPADKSKSFVREVSSSTP